MNLYQRKPSLLESNETGIVALDRFILSTRDSGYKSTASAIAELVDNAMQAKATRVAITIQADPQQDNGFLRVAVADNGIGMDRATLVQALRFGGSSRYNDRAGLGRFGMGLPNASLGQASRVTVHTKQRDAQPLSTYLDVDEVASGQLTSIPTPKRSKMPEWVDGITYQNTCGTTVVWERCDRLDGRRVSTIERKLHQSLGRAFRYFIWKGTTITVNGKPVLGIDPLFLHAQTHPPGARLFQEPISLEIYADPDRRPQVVGQVEVRFSELPVDSWHDMSNEDKRQHGIANGAGVSIVRGGREVDYGWFFMGTKRRENYDDWWRCEIKFLPELDEAFGITHTKQQIRPKDFLNEALQPIVETTAKALNGRVRDAHLRLKSYRATTTAEQIATKRDSALQPLPRSKRKSADQEAINELAKRHNLVQQLANASNETFYKIIEDDLPEASFYKPIHAERGVISVVNPRHTFYKRLYQPLRDSTFSDAEALNRALQLVLLAAARAEAGVTDREEKKVLEKFRRSWSEILDVLLRG